MLTPKEVKEIKKEATKVTLEKMLKSEDKSSKKPKTTKKKKSEEEYFDIILEQDVIITKELYYSVKAKNVKEAGEKVLYDYDGTDADVEEISVCYKEDTEDYFGIEERPNSFRIINPNAKGKKRILYQE